MRKILSIVLCIVFLVSCQKEYIIPKEKVVSKVYVGKVILDNTIITARPQLDFNLLLNLNPGSQNTADGCVIVYDKSFTRKIGNEDSHKISNPDENLGINEGGTILSIEGKGWPYNDSTFLHIWNFRQSNYYLQITATNFPRGYAGYVYDRYLHKRHYLNLYGTTTIQFTANKNWIFRYKVYVRKQ